MRIARVDANRPDPAVIAEAAGILRSGGLVAFPTETVYGVGANATNVSAVARIFAAKGRPSTNPLIVHVPDTEAAKALTRSWPPACERLSTTFWPGPLTVVLPKSPLIPDSVTAGLETVAIRVPDHPVALALLRAAELPIAAPSANPFMRLSPTTAEHVVRGLGASVDLILDAGPASVGIESTVIDLTRDRPVLLRSGTISIERIEAALGVGIELATASTPGQALPSPGMLARHYSPRARVLLFSSSKGLEVDEALRTAVGDAARPSALLIESPSPSAIQDVVRLPSNAGEYARLLYASLHELDERGADVILVEMPPEHPDWVGVRDRLQRAATPTPVQGGDPMRSL